VPGALKVLKEWGQDLPCHFLRMVTSECLITSLL
jgi:hypothetical protein